jgi:hypothetical protein
MSIVINITKAKAIAHGLRRNAREKEFKPYDEIIMKQIPGNDYVAAETRRQELRKKYEAMQVAIDAATTPEKIKTALG